jgi:molybdate transport system substrate-binding protein
MKKLMLVAFLLAQSIFVYAGDITIFAAANLSSVMDEIIKSYHNVSKQDNVKAVYSSSGKAYQQVVNGAPFDIFLSADMFYPEKLSSERYAITKPKVYAIGRLVMWTRNDSNIDVKKGIEIVKDSNVKKIAVANPTLAPYGKATVECMEYYKLYDIAKSKIVWGENISQTAQYAETGAAEIGFIPLSFVAVGKMKDTGKFILIDDKCHKPIAQGVIILKNASENKEKLDTANRFYNYLFSNEVKNLFRKYGYEMEK